MTNLKQEMVELDEETRAAISEGLAQARRGEFVPDAEINALWKRYGLSGPADKRRRPGTTAENR